MLMSIFGLEFIENALKTRPPTHRMIKYSNIETKHLTYYIATMHLTIEANEMAYITATHDEAQVHVHQVAF